MGISMPSEPASKGGRLDNIGDLHEAIVAQQQTVRLIPDGHPHKPGHFSGFVISFIRLSVSVTMSNLMKQSWLSSIPSVSLQMVT